MNTNAEPRAATRGHRWFARSNRLLFAGLLAAMTVLSLVAQVALAGPPSPTGVPGQIMPGDGNKVFLVGHGVGVQIYTCSGSVWSSAVPRANLYGDNGKLIITHFAGPSWQAKDGSKAVGTVVNKVTPDLSAIPWVLLSAKTTPGQTVTGSWTRRSSSGSTPLAASSPRPRTATRQRQAPWSSPRTRPSTCSGSTPARDLTTS